MWLGFLLIEVNTRTYTQKESNNKLEKISVWFVYTTIIFSSIFINYFPEKIGKMLDTEQSDEMKSKSYWTNKKKKIV